MQVIVYDIESVLVDLAQGNVQDVQRLRVLIEQALARLLEQSMGNIDRVPAERAMISQSITDLPLNASDEVAADRIARRLADILRRGG